MRRIMPVVVLGLVACGGGDGGGGGDDDGGTGPDVVSVAGTWLLTVPELGGDGFNCSTSGMTMVLNMSSVSAFSGGHSPGTLTCVGADPVGFVGGPILNGVLNENRSLSFDFDNDNFQFTGALNGSETGMAGTAVLDLGDGTILNGTWTATRQSTARASRAEARPSASLGELLARRPR